MIYSFDISAVRIKLPFCRNSRVLLLFQRRTAQFGMIGLGRHGSRSSEAVVEVPSSINRLNSFTCELCVSIVNIARSSQATVVNILEGTDQTSYSLEFKVHGKCEVFTWRCVACVVRCVRLIRTIYDTPFDGDVCAHQRHRKPHQHTWPASAWTLSHERTECISASMCAWCERLKTHNTIYVLYSNGE